MALKNVVKPIIWHGRILEAKSKTIVSHTQEVIDANETAFNLVTVNNVIKELIEHVENDIGTIQDKIFNISAGENMLRVGDATIEPILNEYVNAIPAYLTELGPKCEEKLNEAIKNHDGIQERANDVAKTNLNNRLDQTINRLSQTKNAAQYIKDVITPEEKYIAPINFYEYRKKTIFFNKTSKLAAKIGSGKSGLFTGHSSLYVDTEVVEIVREQISNIAQTINTLKDEIENSVNVVNDQLRLANVRTIPVTTIQDNIYGVGQICLQQLYEQIGNSAQAAIDFAKQKEEHPWATTAATIGMLGSKFYEGFYQVFEDVGDGVASITLGWFSAAVDAVAGTNTNEAVMNVIKTDIVKTGFSWARNVTGINKYSAVTETSLISSIPQTFGAATGYLTLGGYLSGLGSSSALLSSTTNANTIVAYLGGRGSGTAKALNSGDTFISAQAKGIGQGLVQGAIAYGAGKLGERHSKKIIEEETKKANKAVQDADDALKNYKASTKNLDDAAQNLDDYIKQNGPLEDAQKTIDDFRNGSFGRKSKSINKYKEYLVDHPEAENGWLGKYNKIKHSDYYKHYGEYEKAIDTLGKGMELQDDVLNLIAENSKNYSAVQEAGKIATEAQNSLDQVQKIYGTMANPQGYTDAITTAARAKGQNAVGNTVFQTIKNVGKDAIAADFKPLTDTINVGKTAIKGVNGTIKSVGDTLKNGGLKGLASETAKTITGIPNAAVEGVKATVTAAANNPGVIAAGINGGLSTYNSITSSNDIFKNNENNSDSSASEKTPTDETTTPPKEDSPKEDPPGDNSQTETPQENNYIYQNGNEYAQPRIDTNEPVQEPSTDSSTTPAKEPSNPSTDSTTKPSTPVDPDPLPSNKPTPEPTPSPKPEPTPEVTPTPEPTPTPSPSYEPQPTNTPTPTGHSGGSYSGGGGYNYYPSGGKDTVTTETLKDTTGKTKTAIDDIIKGNKYSKIPTVTTPITSKTTSGSASVIPIAAGLSAAAAAGIGAKAYMDHKKNNNNEDDVYDEEEYKDDFSAEEWKNDNNNLEIEEAEEPKEEYLDEDDEFGYEAPSEEYNARTTESLAEFE